MYYFGYANDPEKENMTAFFNYENPSEEDLKQLYGYKKLNEESMKYILEHKEQISKNSINLHHEKTCDPFHVDDPTVVPKLNL